MTDPMSFPEPPRKDLPAPLSHFTEEALRHSLRGFSDAAQKGAFALRAGSETSDFEACLFGILMFFRPAGSPTHDELPSPTTRLREDLGLDSLSMMEAMFKVEELFDISVSNSELAEIITIADARRLLEEKLRLRIFP